MAHSCPPVSHWRCHRGVTDALDAASYLHGVGTTRIGQRTLLLFAVVVLSSAPPRHLCQLFDWSSEAVFLLL